LPSSNHNIVKEKTNNKSVLQEKASKKKLTTNTLNQDQIEESANGENKASKEQTFGIEEINKDSEKKKTAHKSGLQEKESKTTKLFLYNTSRQTDKTLNKD
jgi:hypothetical protein